MIRTCTAILALFAFMALAGPTAAEEADKAKDAVAAADSAAWNQDAATEAAKALEAKVGEIFKSIELQDGAIQARQNKTFVVAEDLRSLRRISRRLSRELASGAGREDTAPLFTRTMRMVDRLRLNMPGTPSFVNEIDKIHEARAQLDVLAPMYGVTLPPPVAAPSTSN